MGDNNNRAQVFEIMKCLIMKFMVEINLREQYQGLY